MTQHVPVPPDATMLNKKTIYKIVGSLLFIEAALLLVCLVIALAYH